MTDEPVRSTRAAGRRVRSFWPQYLAISPFYLIFAVFGLFPVLFSLYLAFHRWDGLGEMQYVGLDQFRYLLDDGTFWLSMRNTFVIWFVSTIPMLFIALVIATMLHSTVRFTAFYRVAYFVPNITSLVAMTIFFGAVFGTNFGLVNGVLQWAGLPSVRWLSDPLGMKIAVATVMTWQWTGYNAIIYLAGLQTIPSEVYEAARVDGAGPVQIFFRITVPMLRPIILFTVVVSTITGMQSFTEPQVLFGTNTTLNPNTGGPGNGALTMVLYFYHQAFDNRDFGYGAAIAWMVFLVVMLFAAINWRLVQRREK
ncbi:cellobiose transport system permease protein [Kibdelosporangium banguiense]|uniref:Cellobiose transport system permease protein n=1 Tax=Kibdelosporangium banguiense TaxID=1365924 RepID=A0ABS4TRB9_9PSEU|nr:sugar ABC transporter permease [Kibdelosporangium banguiense]MBP2326495.1 cellobiose transport system permease protein [Kibdelosporangium banguiense]